MPIVRIQASLVYFAHVPKCAGTSVENYLQTRFGPLAFLDRKYSGLAAAERWTSTSPQHVDAASLRRLFPDGWFAASFALVRHPLTRLASAYLFQRDNEGRIPDTLSFGSWLAEVTDNLPKVPFQFDNHSRPMTDFVPPDAVVFRIEDGTGALIDWLDNLAGDRSGPRKLPHVNSRQKHLTHYALPDKGITIDPDDIRLVADRYAADFARFGYDPDVTFVQGSPQTGGTV